MFNVWVLLLLYLFFYLFPSVTAFFFFLVTNWPMTGLDWAGYAQVCHKLKDLAELMREANDNSPSLLSFGEQFSCIQSHFSVYIRKTKLLFPTASSVLLLSLRWIGYNYTVEVRTRLTGLDLIDKVTEELWTEVHDIVQESA